MKILRLVVRRFTAFEDATFELGSWVNVFIGENGTGKSHVLKLLYALSEAVRRFESGETLDVTGNQAGTLDAIVAEMLSGVFRPDALGRLVRRGRGRRSAKIELTWDGGALEVTLSSLGKVTTRRTGELSSLGRAIFLPPREVLTLFPGFVSAYMRRELEFDRTYYDLCVALDAKPLRGPRDAVRAALLAPIEAALGGQVGVENGRFYLDLQDGRMEAPLVAEGLRKLAMLAQLIVNGSLADRAFLFWDEPEANMNPKLSELTREIVFRLAGQGVQVFLATHDYVLTSDLSLAVEADAQWRTGTVFFSLVRREGQEGVAVERGLVLAELQDNAILDAFASLHAREREAFDSAGGAGEVVR
jgi:ABC-type transport system involved in cytochrome c biogenesis ATPase subunit